MNLVLLFERDFIEPGRIRLSGRRARHVATVHRAAVGSTLRVGLVNDRLGSGRVIAIGGDHLEMEVVLEQPAPRAVPVTLLLALPRPKTLKKVLQAAAALGVKRIVLMGSWRVEKSFWQSRLLSATALQEELLLGLEQAADTVLPEVVLRRRFKPFVEDELPALARGTRAFVAHPAAEGPCPRAVTGPVTLAVGPEGGFIPYEVERLQAQGFVAVSLGPRRLRVEHAVPALLGRLL